MAVFYLGASRNGMQTVLPSDAFEAAAELAEFRASGCASEVSTVMREAVVAAGTFLFVADADVIPAHEGHIAGTLEELNEWVRAGGHHLLHGRLAVNSRPCYNYVPELPPQAKDRPYIRSAHQVRTVFGHNTRVFDSVLV